MHKKLLFISLTVLYATMAVAQDVSTAGWAVQPVMVDGNANEWHKPLNLYDANTKLLFAMGNDSTNIYLCFECKDEQTQKKIMRAGMRVELSTKWNGKRKVSIAYPLPPKERENNDNSFDDGDAGSNQQEDPGFRKAAAAMARQRFLTDNLTMHVEGFINGNGVVPIRGSNINIAMGWDSTNNLFYEIAIPIQQLTSQGYDAEELLKEITLEVAVNALPQRARNHSGGQGGDSEANGGLGPVGTRNINPSDFKHAFKNPDKAGLFKNTYLKQKFVLAGAGTQ
jgi:hypothetical protein